MKNFYFTYGSSEYFPYCYGWTRVIAPDMGKAIELFNMVHPARNGFINCAFYYPASEFERTEMYRGDYGDYEHEVIELTVTEVRA